ncbi:Protein of unknown function [Bacillus cereus]|nr:Protein of unknown function [Bacillus cereus]SCN31722.1 Protein of unknown function [Bacillus wiedmannii]
MRFVWKIGIIFLQLKNMGDACGKNTD